MFVIFTIATTNIDYKTIYELTRGLQCLYLLTIIEKITKNKVPTIIRHTEILSIKNERNTQFAIIISLVCLCDILND